MARLIRVIQSLPADRISALGQSLGVAEAGITAGELARRIYHLLSDRAGIEQVLTQMSTKDRLVLMMIASSPQGRSTMSRLEAEAPFPTEELSEIVERLVNHALIQARSPADRPTLEMETPVEIRTLLRTGANRPRGRVAGGPRRRSVGRVSPPPAGTRDHVHERTRPLVRAKRSADPVSEMTDWAGQIQAGHSVGKARKRRPSQINLAEVLGLWVDGSPSQRRIEQWMALTDQERATITLRAWLHENDLTFAGGPSKDIPARRLVRMAFVAMLSRGMKASLSIRPQQIEQGLTVLGLDQTVPIPRYRWRVMVQSTLDDLEMIGITMPAGDGSYGVKSPSMQLVCANAVEIAPE